jgi:copper chaperone CopZ
MKSCYLLFLSLLAGSALADEPRVYSYEFPVAGVVCSACARVVKDSVRGVPGVIDVKIVKRPNGELPLLTVASTDPTLDPGRLRAALGEAAKTYQINDSK